MQISLLAKVEDRASELLQRKNASKQRRYWVFPTLQQKWDRLLDPPTATGIDRVVASGSTPILPLTMIVPLSSNASVEEVGLLQHLLQGVCRMLNQSV